MCAGGSWVATVLVDANPDNLHAFHLHAYHHHHTCMSPKVKATKTWGATYARFDNVHQPLLWVQKAQFKHSYYVAYCADEALIRSLSHCPISASCHSLSNTQQIVLFLEFLLNTIRRWVVCCHVLPFQQINADLRYRSWRHMICHTYNAFVQDDEYASSVFIIQETTCHVKIFHRH